MRAWNVTDDAESDLFKTSKGGHFKENISTMSMSPHLGLVATGSFSGYVTIWDFEVFKPVGLLKGHKLAVKAI